MGCVFSSPLFPEFFRRWKPRDKQTTCEQPGQKKRILSYHHRGVYTARFADSEMRTHSRVYELKNRITCRVLYINDMYI